MFHLEKTLIALTACAIVLAALVSAPPVAAETCYTPPANALAPSASEDDTWLQYWCFDSQKISTLWTVMDLKKSDWDDGWGFYDICNVNRFLPRLMSAGYLVAQVQGLAQYTNELHPPTNNPYNSTSTWWSFVDVKEDDGFEPKCCNGDPGLNASHGCCGASTDLCVKWAYKLSLVQRASTLVHESTHEDVGHISDNACANGASCDSAYGQYNANTMQINFLYDALSAYQTVNVNNQTQHKVAVWANNGLSKTCGFLPLLSANERTRALDEVHDRMAVNFQGSTFSAYGTVAAVDNTHDAKWTCDYCNPMNYVFDPATYWNPQNHSCNEKLNTNNILVNLANKATCQDYNVGIPQQPSAQDYSAHHWDFVTSQVSCLPPDPDDVQAYCDAEKATANNVSELDEDGFLGDAGFWEETECLVEYCEESFDPAWKQSINNPFFSDPLGCMYALCKGDQVCRRMYLRWEGDPDYYVRWDEHDHCKENWVECYDAAGIVPNPPDTCDEQGCQPTKVQAGQLECNLARKQCEELMAATKKMIVKVQNMLLVTPSVVEEAKGDPWVNPPVFDFQQKMAELEEELASGVLSQTAFDDQVASLTRYPESLYAMFEQSRDAFVSLLGVADYEAIVGPEIRDVTAMDPHLLPLTPEGTAALGLYDQLQAVADLFDPAFLAQRIMDFERVLSPAEFDAWQDYMNQATALEAAVELEAGP